jgi:hypothetical protein
VGEWVGEWVGGWVGGGTRRGVGHRGVGMHTCRSSEQQKQLAIHQASSANHNRSRHTIATDTRCPGRTMPCCTMDA